jgi:LPS sulfotransferase NodH
VKKFVIFSFPRTGSTYLCSRLNAHPQIVCHYEVFHPDEIATAGKRAAEIQELAGFTPRTRDEDPARFMDALFSHDRGQQATGFKIFVEHSEAAHGLILADRSIAKILLRRSTVDAYVSMIIAQQTGEYTSSSAAPTTRQVEIKAGGLLAFDRRITSYFAEIEDVLRRSGQRYHSVTYEELVAGAEALDGIFRFIGIERGTSELKPFTVRQNSEALEDKVSNLKEVVEDLVRLYREKR